MAAEWGAGANWTTTPGPHPKEAALLALNCDKAAGLLAWRPTWRLEDLVRNTARWYRTWLDDPSELKAETFRQTAGFERDMFARGVGRVA